MRDFSKITQLQSEDANPGLADGGAAPWRLRPPLSGPGAPALPPPRPPQPLSLRPHCVPNQIRFSQCRMSTPGSRPRPRLPHPPTPHAAKASRALAVRLAPAKVTLEPRQTALPSRTSKTNRGDAHSRVITQTRDHELRPEQRRRTGWQQREPRGLGRGAFRKTATPGLPPEGCERAGRGRQEEQEERDEGRPRARKRKQLVWLGTPRKREVGGDETAGGTGAWAAAAGILDSILSVAEGLGAGR